MVASGVPEENDTHAADVTLVALELLEKIDLFKVAHKPE